MSTFPLPGSSRLFDRVAERIIQSARVARWRRATLPFRSIEDDAASSPRRLIVALYRMQRILGEARRRRQVPRDIAALGVEIDPGRHLDDRKAMLLDFIQQGRLFKTTGRDHRPGVVGIDGERVAGL